VVGEMRLFKGPEEVQVLRKAGRASALAHKAAMEQTRPGMNEHDVWSLVEYIYRKEAANAKGMAPLWAAGETPPACITGAMMRSCVMGIWF